MQVKKYTASALLVAMLVTNSGPWIPMALASPIVPDAGKLGPQMDEARNGMTVVNINTPNQHGLSHNQYQAFGIDAKGAILNNANRPVNTQLAGYIMGNPNMVGPTATTILNEVTGTGNTSLTGALEVAGNRANVVIANPNGISVNNGTFINANNVTLTTGNAIINDGKLAGYNVNQGTIAIEGQGLNTKGASRTDLLSEAVQMNAKVWAQDSQVVTGQNQISVNGDGKVTNVTKTGDSTKVGLDVAATGGMYANTMYLVGTNTGFGVNNQGILSAQHKITVDSTGKVVNSGTIATTTADIKADTIEQIHNGKIYADSARLVTNTLKQTGDGTTAPVIIARKELNIASSSIENTGGSTIKSEGTIHLGKTLDANGFVTGKMDRITNIGSNIEAVQGGRIDVGLLHNKNAGFTIKQIQIGESETIKDEVTSPDFLGQTFKLKNDKIHYKGDLTPDSDEIMLEDENIQFYKDGHGHDDWTRYNYTRTKSKDVIDTSNPGRILAGNDIEINADHVINDGSQISSAGEITGHIKQYDEINPQGNEYITDVGTAVSYSRHHHHGRDSTNIDRAPLNRVTKTPMTIPLAVNKSHDSNSQTDLTMDNTLLNSMSQMGQNPNTTYIMETDPNFTNRRNFLSSDYVLNRLKLDPTNIQKRLGDGYYEQQLVMQDIMRQTGKTRLQTGLSAEEQYRRLMDAGIKLTKARSLAFGRPLTESEQQQLTEDVVLLVSKPVVLPNGTTEIVLVPTLYVAPTTKRVDGGANMQAKSIDLRVENLNTSGSIVADDRLTVVADNVHNEGGLLSGDTTRIIATQDVVNEGGTIRGNTSNTVIAQQDVINRGGRIEQTGEEGKQIVAAGRDVINSGRQYEAMDNTIVWDDKNKRHENLTAVQEGVISGKGDTLVHADRDVVMQAGNVQSSKAAEVTAGRDVHMGAMDATYEITEDHHHVGKSGGGHKQTNTRHDEATITNAIGSTVSGKSVSVKANGTATLEGSNVLAEDKAIVQAKEVSLNTSHDTMDEKHTAQMRKKSMVKRESIEARNDVQMSSVNGSVISGKSVEITGVDSVTGQSATILGENGVVVQSGGAIELGADKIVADSQSAYQHKKSGVLGGAGIGFSIGKERLNTDDTSHEEQSVRSTIASTKGKVDIHANDTLHLTSTNVLSKEGTQLVGSEVLIDGNTDRTAMMHNESYKKSGLTVSLGGAAVDAVNTATRTIKRAGNRNDKRLAALEINEARKQFQDGYDAIDSALHGSVLRDEKGNILRGEDDKPLRDKKNIDNAINLSVSIGSTSRHQNQSVEINLYDGGALVSDGTISITSTDASKRGIMLTGQDVQAKSVITDSANSTSFNAGKNTLHAKDDYKQSGWSVGAGFSLATGSLLELNASGNYAKQNGMTDQTTYKPTRIVAAELAQLKAKQDTNIIGSTIAGKKVKVDTNKLHIESLQDENNFTENSKSAGFSVSSAPKFKNPIGNIGASNGKIDSTWKSVTEQAGIYAGEEGYAINTGDTTSLKGAVIASKAKKDKNTLATKHLQIEDIQNEAEYTMKENGIQYNHFGNLKDKSKNEFDKIYKHLGATPTGGIGAKGKASSTTKSAISEGIIKEDGHLIDMKTLNTDVEHSLNELQTIFDRQKIEEKQELARLFTINANEAIHRLAAKEGWKDGDARKVALHTLVGGMGAKLGGNQFSDGAYAAGINEAMLPQLKKIAGTIKGPDGKEYVDPASLQQLSYVLGYATNKTLGGNPQTGAYVAYMGTKYNYSAVSEWIPGPIARWMEKQMTVVESRIPEETYAEPPVVSYSDQIDEDAKALYNASKTGNPNYPGAAEAAERVEDRLEETKVRYTGYSPDSDEHGFYMTNQGIQPTGVNAYGQTYYIKDGKTYISYSVSELDDMPWNIYSNNHGYWKAEQGEVPSGVANGHVYYNSTRMENGVPVLVTYIGPPADMDIPLTFTDKLKINTMKSEDDLYTDELRLNIVGGRPIEKLEAKVRLQNKTSDIGKNWQNFTRFDIASPNVGLQLKDNNIPASGIDLETNRLYYDIKQPNGELKRLYGGSIESYQQITDDDSYNRSKETFINNMETGTSQWLLSTLEPSGMPKVNNEIAYTGGAAVRFVWDKAFVPGDYAHYLHRIGTSFNDNILIYEPLDAYDANKGVVVKAIPDIGLVLWGYQSKKDEPYKKEDFVNMTPANAGIGSNSDLITTNAYNYYVSKIKTRDKKTDEDRKRDIEYYINRPE